MHTVLKSVVVGFVLLAFPALAKGAPTHQCTKGGAVVPLKKKECPVEGGKWEPIPVKAAAPKAAAK